MYIGSNISCCSCLFLVQSTSNTVIVGFGLLTILLRQAFVVGTAGTDIGTTLGHRTRCHRTCLFDMVETSVIINTASGLLIKLTRTKRRTIQNPVMKEKIDMEPTLLSTAMFQEANFNATKQAKRQCFRENGLINAKNAWICWKPDYNSQKSCRMRLESQHMKSLRMTIKIK